VRLAARIGPAVVLPLAIAACGGGSTTTRTTSTGPGNVTEKPSSPVNGQRTFSAPGMAVHFTYPERFRAVALAPSRRTAGTTERATHSAIAIGDYDLVISQVLGRKVSGKVGSAGGRPAIYWPREPVVGLPVKATVTIVNLFLGKDEYELQCQATPAGLTQIEAACQEMLATLTTQSPS